LISPLFSTLVQSRRGLDIRHPPLHLQLSQLKLIHAVRTVPGVYVSTTIAALEDAYTNANLLETICQIRGDELDDAVTQELAPPLGSLARLGMEIARRSPEVELLCVPCPTPPSAMALLSH
jgi:hypothetical protein